MSVPEVTNAVDACDSLREKQQRRARPQFSVWGLFSESFTWWEGLGKGWRNLCVCVYAFFLNQICFISLRSMYKFNKLGWGVGRHFCAVFAFIQDLRKSSTDLNIVASVKL